MNHLKKVDGKETFWLKENEWKVISELHSIPDLASALKSAPSGVVQHHLADNRNDFAAWVEAVFHEHSLANKLRHVRRDDPEAQKKLCEALDGRLTKINPKQPQTQQA